MEGAKKRLEETPSLALSLRSVADLLGMAPSAIYRYFPSREALITALCIDSYNELANYVERELLEHGSTEENVSDDFPGTASRWRTLCRSYRNWGLAHPSEFALLFGPSQADEVTDIDETIAAARRFGDLGLQIFIEGIDTGAIALPADLQTDHITLTQSFANSVLDATQIQPADFPVGVLLSGWVNIHGAVCLEIFGFLSTMIADTETFFEEHLDRTMRLMGFGQDR